MEIDVKETCRGKAATGQQHCPLPAPETLCKIHGRHPLRQVISRRDRRMGLPHPMRSSTGCEGIYVHIARGIISACYPCTDWHLLYRP